MTRSLSEQLKKTTLVSLGTLILILVTACSHSIKPTATAGPVGISDIPIYGGATPIDADDSIEASMVIVAMAKAISDKDIAMEARAYALPTGATWDDVKAFYKKTLESTDWRQTEKLTDESAEHKSAGWRRGAGASEQILITTCASNISGEGSTLIIMLFTK